MRIRGQTIWKTGGSLLALAAVFAIAIAVNMLAGGLRLRYDLTDEKLYTVGDGTRRILKQLDQEIRLKFFYSSNITAMPVPLKNFAQRVSDLLKEYEVYGGGLLVVEKYDPRPDSDAEDDANRFGLTSQRLPTIGSPKFYMGLAAVAGDQVATIPWLEPGAEELLEYNITRLIYTVAHPKKPKIGVLSSLPVLGEDALPFAMPGQPRPQPQPPWLLFSELEQDYSIEEVPTSSDSIDAELDALVLVHPKKLGAKTLYAIDQYLLGGGRLLVFLDPLCIVDPGTPENPEMGMPGMPNRTSELNRLLEAWGISQESGMVVGDLTAMTRVGSQDGNVIQNPAWLSLTRKHMNPDEVVTTGLDTLMLPFAATFAGDGAKGLAVTPLVSTSEDSAQLHTMTLQMNPEGLLSNFEPGLKKLNLAVKLHGKFKTAFPDGKPKNEDEDDEDADKDKKDETDKPKEPEEKGLAESTAPSTVILVGDVDMLHERWCVEEVSFWGLRARQRSNDNMNFFLNALELLAGSQDLVTIRSRGRFNRPFEKVVALQREAQTKWREKENALQKKLDRTREKLRELEGKKDKEDQRFIWSAEQKREIERFREEETRISVELKDVRKELRKDIEWLGFKLKIINCGLMPALVAVGGLGFAFFRRHRAKK
ncbi:MAG: GldG family protein [Kiritimatiellae bacterium]|nr:GldG family protein [Kiritimatiellia bacterium]